jgi:hypothetical protein
VVKDVDVMGAWYHFTQPTYGVGCTSATAATCYGTEDAFSGVSGRREPGAVRADYLVDRRGFEPLTSAVQAAARLTGSSLPRRFVGVISQAQK